MLIIGDLMLDTYLWGKTDRISPEAPVPVVTIVSKESRPGGAANVALNILSMGAKPVICGAVGNDEKGELLIKLLKNKNIDISGIIIDKHRPTTSKTRIICNNQHMLRADEESTSPLENEIAKSLEKRIFSIMVEKNIDAIIFEDYDKGLITVELIEKIIHQAKKKKVPVLVDPKKRNFHLYKNVDLFKPNFKEFNEGLKTEFSKKDIKGISLRLKSFRKKQNIENILLTLSDAGILCCNKEGTYHVPAIEKLDVADVSGAGDTVISVAALCLVAGIKLHDIAFISNLAGALVCEKPGVVPIDRKQLILEIQKRLK